MMAAVLRDSDDIVERHGGVVLRYSNPATVRPHHTDDRIHPSDRERSALLKARDALLKIEGRLLTMCVIGTLGGLGDYGLSRFKRELHETQQDLATIRRSLTLMWDRVGMGALESAP